MRRLARSLSIVATGLILVATARAGEAYDKAKALLEQDTLQSLEASLPLFDQAVLEAPKDYEVLWRAAMAHREFANQSKEQELKGWKERSAKEGKLAMQLATRAIEADGKRVEGHFWYGCSVGTYADGVSILTALKEGLKDKTQQGFEKSYAIDKQYHEAGPVLALGRFWSALPWPLKDNKKALVYLDEFQKYYPDNAEGQLYLGECLADEGGDANKARARTYLEKAAQGKEPFYRNRAKALLASL
jgi:tetratricopeptide (TPR) repeat protein